MKMSYVSYAYPTPVDYVGNDKFLGAESFESLVILWEDESIEELDGVVIRHVFGPYSDRGRVPYLGTDVEWKSAAFRDGVSF